MRLHIGREALGGFIQRWGGGSGGGGGGWNHSTQFQIRIKQPATSTVRRLFFLELQHPNKPSQGRVGGLRLKGAPVCVYMAVVWCV